jgi:hypothetical protein
MSGFRMKGPRFALTNPEHCSACIKCVYGNGEHAEWCEKANPKPVPGLPDPERAQTPVERETETAEKSKGTAA